MRLKQLLTEIVPDELDRLRDQDVAAVTADSRKVIPGSIFVAVRGETVDGHDFLGDAVERGAVALVGEAPDPQLGVPYLRRPNTRLALAHLAAAWYGYPARKLVMIGVTGTDGKTTTCHLIYHILRAAGLRPGMITTVNALIGDEVLDTGFHVTTPETVDVQRYLAQMAAAGLTHCVLEATSQGLVQERVAACEFDVAVLTNLTHEHLDYHGTFESYRAAKGKLFSQLAARSPKPAAVQPTAVLNLEDASFDFFRELAAGRRITYAVAGRADVRAEDIAEDVEGMRFKVVGSGFEGRVETPLTGLYNVANCLAAISATVVGLGIEARAAWQGVAAEQLIPGRMERIDLGQDFGAVVDFAHTPNGLRRALEAVRPRTRGKLIAVLGAAGLRDREKRRLMGRVASELADETVFTAEDPRTESLDDILEAMAHGAREAGGREGVTFWKVPDRGDALRFAVSRAGPGDVVIACGKGHEQSMCFGETEYPWDDRTALRAAINERLGVAGPTMPPLPTSR